MDGFKLISKQRKSIMGLAGIMILFFHGWELRFGQVPVISSFEGFLKQNGYLGVDMFLFLSGFGLYYAMEKGKIGKYYAHRLGKLFPPVIVAALVYTLINNKGILFFIKAVSGYGFYFESIYTFLWYTTAIITISLLFPLYYFLMKKFANPVIFTILSLTVWFVLTMALRNVLRIDLYSFTDRLPIFMLGTLAGYLSKEKSFSFDMKTWITILAVWITGIYCVNLYMNKGVEFIVPMSGCFIPPVLFAAPFVLLLAGLFEKCQNGRFIPGFFKGIDKGLSFIGGFTLELYCVQEMVIDILKKSVLRNAGVLTRNILAFLIAILAGYVLHLLLNCYKLFMGKQKMHSK